MSQTKAQKAAAKAAKAVAAAYRSSLTGGSYGAAIAAKADALAAASPYGSIMASMMTPYKKPRPKLTAAEKAARKRVRAAHGSMARAARLPGKKKRTTKKKTASRAAAPQARNTSMPKKPKTPKLRTLSADAVIKGAASAALKKWACEGPRRSGCGSGGTRVVNHGSGKDKLIRIRPLRQLMY